MLWKVDWYVIQRMIMDTPNYDYEKKEEEINLTEESSESLMDKLKNWQ